MTSSNPSEEELLRVFGEEALPANKVIKTETTDPDGVTTVVYTTQEGTTIASALRYKEHDNFLPLDNEPFIGFNVKNSIVKNRIIDEQKFLSEKKINFFEMESIKVDYYMSPVESKTLGCFTAVANAATCNYKVFIEIIDNSNNNVIAKSDSLSVSSGALQTFTSSNWTIYNNSLLAVNSTDNTLLDIQKGSYSFKKTLFIDNDLESEAALQARSVPEAIEPVNQVLIDWLDNMKQTQDFVDFIDHVNIFSDQLESMGDAPLLGAVAGKVEDFRLGAYLLSVEEMNSVNNMGINLEFSPISAYDPQYPDSLPDLLTINTNCCGAIEIPLNYDPLYVCPSNLDDITPAYTMGFVNYLEKQITSDPFFIENSDVTFESLCPGYTKDMVSKLFYHMLTDEYSIEENYAFLSEVERNDPTTINPATGQTFNVKTQYACPQVWDCWISSVDITKEMIEAQLSENIDMRNDSVNDGGEGSKDNQDDNLNEAFDDAPGGWFLKLLIGDKISDKLDENPESSIVPIDENLISSFLNCTGYKFAKILAPMDENGFDTDDATINSAISSAISNGSVPSGHTDKTYMPFEGDAQDYFLQTTGIDNVEKGYNSPSLRFNGLPSGDPFEGKLRIPYIKSPIYAFKYFEYGIDTASSLTPRKYLSEVSHCMIDFDQKLKNTMGSSAEFCRPEAGCVGESYKNWNNLTKLNYYNSIKYVTELSFTVDATELVKAQTIPTKEELDSALQDIVDLCNVNCEDKKSNIRNQVLQEFSDNCFVLEGCAQGDYTISYSEIDAIVEQLVSECKNECYILDSTTKVTTCPDGVSYNGGNYPCYKNVPICYELNITPGKAEPFVFIGFTGLQKYLVTSDCIYDQFELMRGTQLVLDLNLPVDNPNCGEQVTPDWLDSNGQICPPSGGTTEYTEVKSIEVGIE